MTTAPLTLAETVTPATVHAAQGGALARRLAAGGLLGAVFVACFTLGVRNNDFPLYYHEDEPHKVGQVLSRTRNFHHPQLLLESVQAATDLLGTGSDPQSVARVWRGTSAAFAALAACALAGVGYRAGGLGGMAAAGAAVGLCPALVVYAHYMKEDAALVFGVALTVLAAHVFWSRRDRPRDTGLLALLGAACGVAASGKFVGALALVGAVPLVVLAGRLGVRAAGARLLVVFVAFAVVVLVVNHRAFRALPVAAERVPAEVSHATAGRPSPNTYQLSMFVRQCMPHVLLMSATWAAFVVARRRGRSDASRGWDVFLLLLAVAFLAVVSFSALPFNRYVLPAMVLAHLAAALAAVRAGRALAPAWRPAAAAVPVAAAVLFAALQLPRCLDFVAQFGDDSRERLRAWVLDNLPPDAVFVQDHYVALQEPFDRRRGGAVSGRSGRDLMLYGGDGFSAAPAAGDLEHLRAIGVEYVAVTDILWDRYLDPRLRGCAPSPALAERYRRWYEALFRDHELVWSSAARHKTYSTYNNPEIRLYRLRPATAGAGPDAAPEGRKTVAHRREPIVSTQVRRYR